MILNGCIGLEGSGGDGDTLRWRVAPMYTKKMHFALARSEGCAHAYLAPFFRLYFFFFLLHHLKKAIHVLLVRNSVI